MGKRIYEVEVSKTLYVYAEDAAEAEDIAIRHVDEDGEEYIAASVAIDDVSTLPRDVRNSLPWGDAAGDRTIAQIVGGSR